MAENQIIALWDLEILLDLLVILDLQVRENQNLIVIPDRDLLVGVVDPEINTLFNALVHEVLDIVELCVVMTRGPSNDYDGRILALGKLVQLRAEPEIQVRIVRVEREDRMRQIAAHEYPVQNAERIQNIEEVLSELFLQLLCWYMLHTDVYVGYGGEYLVVPSILHPILQSDQSDQEPGRPCSASWLFSK